MTLTHSLILPPEPVLNCSRGLVLESRRSLICHIKGGVRSLCKTNYLDNKSHKWLLPSSISPFLPMRSSDSSIALTSRDRVPLLDTELEDPHAATTSCLTSKAQHGDSCISSVTVLGFGLVACSFLFPQSSLAGAEVESSFATAMTFAGAEPSNALSLPTWTIHVASVAEWVIAMVLVWNYGDAKRNSGWKGLTWGMVPLLGGAMCACTWHFFYNAESLEVLVVLQAFLTVVGNFTMWAAAYRIWKLSQEEVRVD